MAGFRSTGVHGNIPIWIHSSGGFSAEGSAAILFVHVSPAAHLLVRGELYGRPDHSGHHKQWQPRLISAPRGLQAKLSRHLTGGDMAAPLGRRGASLPKVRISLGTNQSPLYRTRGRCYARSHEI